MEKRLSVGNALGALALAPLVALGQTPTQPDSSQVKLEKVEVTGTNVRRTDAETGLPVQVITRQEIERSGVITAQDILERVSASQSYGGWNDSLGVGTSLAGFTGASMRGLGSERTLLLLNGRRLAPYALSGGKSVDLSGIPASAIERIEVLKDGASAVYGTDAIGGVMNFILRRDYRGAEANSTYLGVERGGGENARASLTGGAGDFAKDGFNAFATIDHLRQRALPAKDREFSRTSFIPEVGLQGLSPSAFPANISQPALFDANGNLIRPRGFAGQRNPSIPLSGPTAQSCAPPLSFPFGATRTSCGFDYVPLIDNIGESRKTSAVGRLAWRAHPDHTLFAEGSFYRGEFAYKISPTPIPTAFGIEIAPSSPYYPAAFVASIPGGRTNLPVRIAYRLSELGPRVNEPVSEQWRLVAGSQGTFAGWDYQLSAGHTANRQEDVYTSGLVSTSGVRGLFAADAINPFVALTPEMRERLRAVQITGPISDNRASHTSVELKASSTPWELAAGGVGVAAGLEARREELKQVNAPVLFSGDILGGSGAAPSLEPVSRRVISLFAEANVPVSPALEVNLAVRHDQYGDFGGTTNPKLTLRWRAAPGLVVRGSVGSGFRAPTLHDLFAPNVTELGIFASDDPIRCPVTGSDRDCAADFRARNGGNPSLQPETSRQLNAGIVFEPAAGLSVTADFYAVRIEDLITFVPLSAILVTDYPRWASTHVFRLPPTPDFPNLPGPIDYLNRTPVNAGSRQTSGLDVDLRWRLPAAPWGRVTASLSGSYVLRYQASEFEGVGPGTANLVTGTGALARWRHHAAIDWSRGAWGATLAQTFQYGHREHDLTTRRPDGTFAGMRRVGSLSTWDLQVRYTGLRSLTASAGVRNLLDRDPPAAYGPSTFQRGYDASYADPRGRMFYLTMGYAIR